MSVNGTYDCTIKSPMGDQNVTLSVNADGGTFTGTSESVAGAVDLEDGKVDGNHLTWKMKVTQPMAITLDCEATVDGDKISGTVKPGMFGSFPLTGARVG